MITAGDLAGWWRRVWLKTPSGEDHTTHVHWAQADGIYVDLRIPDEPFEGHCIADLDDEALSTALTAEGFAGSTEVADAVCTWTRTINWHGAPKEADIGRMSFGADGDLFEDGVHSDYAERWTLLRDDALHGQRFNADGMTAYLSCSDSHFAFGAGRPEAPPNDNLAAAVRGGARPDALTRHFQAEYMIGRWEGDNGVIELSTTPFRTGDIGLTRAGGLTWLSRDINGGLTAMALT